MSRYNVIEWLHTATRGCSYGASIRDPRTGEIIKGHVSLGSLRAKQDYLLAEGLLSPYRTGDETLLELARMVLARMRQLSAHEVGHTLGFGHNYYDSSAGRISAMDYPHPLETLKADGTIDFTDAYAVGIGEWDKVAVRYAYGQPPPGADAGGRAAGNPGRRRNTRSPLPLGSGSAYHPRADRWANGTDPAVELRRIMRVRRAALDRFGETTITLGTAGPDGGSAGAALPAPPLPGRRRGIGAGRPGRRLRAARRRRAAAPAVPAAEQTAALEALATTLASPELVVPPRVLDALAPRPAGYQMHRELSPALHRPPLRSGHAGPDRGRRDADRGARSGPRRAPLSQAAYDATLPSFGEALDRLMVAIWRIGWPAPTPPR